VQIAFIHPRYPSAEGTGATHSATQIVTGLANAGHDIRVYCPRKPESQLDMANVELRHLTGNSKHPHTDTRLNNEIIARRDELREFDVVHSYLMRLIPSIARVGKAPDVKTVVTLNAYGGVCAKNDLLYLNQEQCQSKSTRKCLNCIARTGFESGDHGYLYQTASQLLSFRLINAGESRLAHIDGYQALSAHVKKKYSNFGYENNKIRVIPNIFDTRFDIDHRSEFTEPFRLLYVGSLEQQKGADRLIDIFYRVCRESESKTRLTIIGDGGLRATLEKQATDHGILDLVDFRSRVPNHKLPEVYAAHDLFMYPGRWDEPFGRVFLEAMAAGTPIVATDVGSIADIVGRAGTVTNQSAPDLAARIESLLDRETLLEYSRAGKKEVQQFYSSEVIPQFERLYQSVLEQ